MQGVCVCLLLALLLPRGTQSQRSVFSSAALRQGDTERNLSAIDLLNRSSVLRSLFPPERRPAPRQARAPYPGSQAPKRPPQGSRFALSLDVPTSILSVLIDLAKNKDMRAKAAANAELMARIGKRK